MFDSWGEYATYVGEHHIMIMFQKLQVEYPHILEKMSHMLSDGRLSPENRRFIYAFLTF